MNKKFILLFGIFFAVLLTNSIHVNGAGQSVSLDPDDPTLSMNEVDFGEWSTGTKSGNFDKNEDPDRYLIDTNAKGYGSIGFEINYFGTLLIR